LVCSSQVLVQAEAHVPAEADYTSMLRRATSSSYSSFQLVELLSQSLLDR
jgi:hypothetical protein